MLHHLHPKNEYPQASRACKYSPFCCHWKRPVRYGDSPFPASAVAKGINTLDFASKIVCQQGCFSPLLETQSQGDIPLWTPHIFFAGWYQNCERQFVTGAKKNKRKHLRSDREGANLPFGADDLKLDMVQFQIISFCCGKSSEPLHPARLYICT